MKFKFNVSVLSLVLIVVLLFTSCTFTKIVTPETETGASEAGTNVNGDENVTNTNGDENESNVSGDKPKPSVSILDLGIGAINDCLADYAYYDYDENKMITAALKAYVAALDDDYAAYYTYSEYLELISEGNGELHGIGIQVVANTVDISGTTYNVYQIVNVFKDSPAIEAGLMPGDLVYAVMVDGTLQTINYLGYDNVLNHVRGEDGTTATLSVFRKIDGEYESVTFSDVVRRKVISYSVTGKISETDPTVGIIKISSFDNTTADQLIEAIESLKAASVEKFVFDLRNNPGGYVNSVCRVLSFFLDAGDVMLSSVNKNGETEKVYRVNAVSGLTITQSDIGRYKGINATVLVNENTASAAEIFTANMMHYKVATVVGTKTFGKGIMQATIPLAQYGYPGFLKVTTNAYCDPSGWCYHGIGITPNEVVELSEEAQNTNLYLLSEADDEQLQIAIQKLH